MYGESNVDNGQLATFIGVDSLGVILCLTIRLSCPSQCRKIWAVVVAHLHKGNLCIYVLLSGRCGGDSVQWWLAETSSCVQFF